MNNVYSLLRERALQSPDKTAFIANGQGISFSELLDLSIKGAKYIQSHIGASSIIMIIVDRSIYVPLCFFSSAISGCTYVPISEQLPEKRILEIQEYLHPGIVINTSSTLLFPGSVSAREVFHSAPGIYQETFRPSIDVFAPLYIAFTSGSTGIPKGVTVAQHGVMDYIQTISELFGITHNDSLATIASFDFDTTIRDIYSTIYVGCTTHILPSKVSCSPKELIDYLNNNKITTLFSWSATALSIPVQTNAIKLLRNDYLKQVFFSGSVLSSRVLRNWQEHLPNTKFYNMYGPTECTGTSTYYYIDHIVEEGEMLYIGCPLPNKKIILLKPLSDTPVADGEIGEICIGGMGVSLGYYNDKYETSRSFIQNPLNNSYNETIYRTGDLGRLDPEKNMIEFHGRMDRQVKVFGYRVELDEIEFHANQIREIDCCAVLYDDSLSVIIFFYEAKSELSKQIALRLRGELPSYMIPRRFIKMERIPRNLHQKVDYKQLLKFYESTK